MAYTEDWFTQNIPKLQIFSAQFNNKPCKILEIGSFEGRSSNWFVENYCTHENSQLTCVDTFGGSWEHSSSQIENLYERFLKNTNKNSSKIRIIKESSEFALPKFLSDSEKFDFIYIDGNHTFNAVMCDIIYSHKLINKEGIIVFDDYMWNVNNSLPKDIPHYAIKFFLNIHGDEYEIIDVNYQVVVKKK